jgi:ubiquinol-cytochrome c reductase cytochrome c1 subunit
MKFLTLLCAAALGLGAGSAALASEGQKTAKDVSFTFEGPFGHFDRGQLQRGFKVYKDSCSNCHGLRLVSFRNLAEPGGPEFHEGQVKTLAATYTFKDKVNADGDLEDRAGLPSDRIASPFANEEAARAANGGALPPDLSLITKARAGWYGTVNQLVNGTGGPEYVYSVLTGYEDPPEDIAKEAPEGKAYNPYFGSGHWIAMPAPLADGAVTFDDGAPNTVDAMAKDVSAFLMWTAEPKLEERKSTGFMVVIYLAILAVLLYLVKQKIWARVEH